MDIKFVAQTTILLIITTLAPTTLLRMLLQVRVLTNITTQEVITEVDMLQRPIIQIHTAIMEDIPIILIMTDLMVGFITGMDITGMRITK